MEWSMFLIPIFGFVKESDKVNVIFDPIKLFLLQQKKKAKLKKLTFVYASIPNQTQSTLPRLSALRPTVHR